MGTTRYSRNIAPGVTRIDYVRDSPPAITILVIISSLALLIGGVLLFNNVIFPAVGDVMKTHIHPVLTWVLFALRLVVAAAVIVATYNRARLEEKRAIWLVVVNALLMGALLLPSAALLSPDAPIFGMTTYSFSSGISLIATGIAAVFIIVAAIFWEDSRGVWIAVLVGYVVLAILFTVTDAAPASGYFGNAATIGLTAILLSINNGYILAPFRKRT